MLNYILFISENWWDPGEFRGAVHKQTPSVPTHWMQHCLLISAGRLGISIIWNFFQELFLSILLHNITSEGAYIHFKIPYLLELVIRN